MQLAPLCTYLHHGRILRDLKASDSHPAIVGDDLALLTRFERMIVDQSQAMFRQT
jgi:hypothetical protein